MTAMPSKKTSIPKAMLKWVFIGASAFSIPVTPASKEEGSEFEDDDYSPLSVDMLEMVLSQ